MIEYDKEAVHIVTDDGTKDVHLGMIKL